MLEQFDNYQNLKKSKSRIWTLTWRKNHIEEKWFWLKYSNDWVQLEDEGLRGDNCSFFADGLVDYSKTRLDVNNGKNSTEPNEDLKWWKLIHDENEQILVL